VSKAKVVKEGFVLKPDATMEEALGAVQDGSLSQAQFLEWDRARSKKAKRGGGNGNIPKTKCPLTAEEFIANAKPITVDLQGTLVTFEPKVFSSGSFGWGFYGKMDIKVGNKPIKVQSSSSLTAVGSKP